MSRNTDYIWKGKMHKRRCNMWAVDISRKRLYFFHTEVYRISLFYPSSVKPILPLDVFHFLNDISHQRNYRRKNTSGKPSAQLTKVVFFIKRSTLFDDRNVPRVREYVFRPHRTKRLLQRRADDY